MASAARGEVERVEPRRRDLPARGGARGIPGHGGQVGAALEHAHAQPPVRGGADRRGPRRVVQQRDLAEAVPRRERRRRGGRRGPPPPGRTRRRRTARPARPARTPRDRARTRRARARRPAARSSRPGARRASRRRAGGRCRRRARASARRAGAARARRRPRRAARRRPTATSARRTPSRSMISGASRPPAAIPSVRIASKPANIRARTVSSASRASSVKPPTSISAFPTRPREQADHRRLLGDGADQGERRAEQRDADAEPAGEPARPDDGEREDRARARRRRRSRR